MVSDSKVKHDRNSRFVRPSHYSSYKWVGLVLVREFPVAKKCFMFSQSWWWRGNLPILGVRIHPSLEYLTRFHSIHVFNHSKPESKTPWLKLNYRRFVLILWKATTVCGTALAGVVSCRSFRWERLWQGDTGKGDVPLSKGSYCQMAGGPHMIIGWIPLK